MRVDFFQQALGVQFGDDLLARFEAFQARIGGRGFFAVGAGVALEGEYGEFRQDAGVLVQHVDQRQVVALAHFVVVEVVGRGDLDAAGAEFRVHIVVADDGDFPAGDGQLDGLADQVLIALVFRVDGDRRIAQHGFRPVVATTRWPDPSASG